MKYTADYFRKLNPSWRLQKASFLVRIFYRPLSYICAVPAAALGISANTVSYCSALVSILGCVLFLFGNDVCNILGALMMNIWLLMDCIDGNLARGVKKQLFGDFADGIAGYILAGFMCSSMAFSVYRSGGLFISEGRGWFLLIGALASESDTLMRLIYHKYKYNENELVAKGILEPEKDVRKDIDSVGSFRVRVEMELGIGGIIPLAALIASVFHALDIIVFYCFFYYGVSCVAMILLYVGKAIKKARMHESC